MRIWIHRWWIFSFFCQLDIKFPDGPLVLTLVLLPAEGGCEEQVYLHLQAELQLREARAEVATLRLQVRQLEAEAVRREAAAETARREHGARVARLDAAKQEDIQTSVGLRLANSNIFHILHKIFFRSMHGIAVGPLHKQITGCLLVLKVFSGAMKFESLVFSINRFQNIFILLWTWDEIKINN